MKLVVGLGNPGSQYDGTRHNVGAEVVELLAREANARLTEKKWRGRVGRGSVAGEDCILLMPQTYMNLSGESVGPCFGFYRLSTDDVVVIHDDIDLELGRLKLKQGGGHGGHNGLRSLDANLPDNNYFRVRIGVGRPPPGWDPASWVLSRFGQDERSIADKSVSRAADAVRDLFTLGLTKASAQHNRSADEAERRPKKPKRESSSEAESNRSDDATDDGREWKTE
ncbi:MAG: aminoacyl-tRNA hydrolase [Deltaproteobacteria bacterium]|nr:aminoacyl-tRNA hydrolase [Deltaproteobacteria bacterium]